ncbi:ABC transporter permease [Stackebrandtia nassauensis]|uniref:ABC transporter transmembrane protein n=1 Tax=Stackebrandtia nassauensis (strain DSM 44728 / CIP 108903 / NRRL B-16338 / NBRC 102104 / LLR-40K-21) TaxID=446470 RepID=D3PXH2_STANL|nr:ABC transporter permease [Stackebrandtia nassauensis]ADD41435.1 hypothetical protein Snas_1737 [Stackebrandtia nassauensis DSM 44728]
MLALIRSELVKARSTRATAWTLPLTIVLTGGLGALLGAAWRNSDLVKDDTAMRFAAFYPLTLSQMCLVVFAVLLVGNEFSTGTIRTSLIAVPGRVRFLTAKFIAGGLILTGVAVLAVAVSQVMTRLTLGDYAPPLDDKTLWLAILGACLYLPMIGLFAMGLTATLRSSIGALGILMPLLFLNSQGFGNIPKVKELAQYLPDQVGQSLMRMFPDNDPIFSVDYNVTGAAFILLAWVATALLGGYLVTRRREA